MADISQLARLINGLTRNVDMAANTLVTSSIKVGGLTPTELTKAILDRLISLQNGSDVDATYHTHDGRYFTETELGSTTVGSSGAKKIGVSGTPTNYTAGSADVQAHLAGIDAAIASAGGTSFNDSNFEIYDNGDNTKKVKVQASAIATGTTRTISMPDADVSLGDIATANAHIANTSNPHSVTKSQVLSGNLIVNSDVDASAAIAESKLSLAYGTSSLNSAIVAAQDDIDDLNILSGVAVNAQNLGSFSGTVIPDNRTIKQAIQDLETYTEASRELIQKFEFYSSVNNKLADPPGSPSSGDRYLIIAPATGVWTGKQDQIAEYNGSAWEYTVPELGSFLSNDAESNKLYYYGGVAWSEKYFEATTASTGLTKVGFDVRLSDANSGAININSGVFSVNVDDSTIALDTSSGNPLKVKDLGITNAKIANDTITNAKISPTAAIAYSKLSIADGDLTIAKTSGLQATLDLKALDADLDAHTGNTSNPHSVTKTQVGLSNVDNLQQLPLSYLDTDGTFAANSDVKVASQKAVKTYVDTKAAYIPSLVESKVAGEAIASGIKAVRTYVSGETAGKFYKATNDASVSDKFYAIGLTSTAGVVADDSIDVVKHGKMTVTGHGLSVGAIYLGADGAITQTSPTAENTAVVLLGFVQDANTIEVKIQYMGIN